MSDRPTFEKAFPVPAGIYWNEISEQYDALPGAAGFDDVEIYHGRWEAWQAARAQPEQPSGGVVPDITSAIVNDCGWTFVKAMPHNLPGPIFNDLKPALYEALKQYHGSMLTAAPTAPAVQGEERPTMPDKFYEGLGWMHAECCAALDAGEDPRGFEIGEIVERCIRDLTNPPTAQGGEGDE